MKKYSILAGMLIGTFLCTACGNDAYSNREISELQVQIDALQEKVSQLENSAMATESIFENDENEQSVDNIESEVPIEKSKEVVLGEPFEVGELMKITLSSAEWCDEILPSNTSGVYSYMSDKEGEKYFLIRGSLESFASEAFDIEYCGEANLYINENYKIPVVMELEELEGTSFYGSVKPLQTLNLIVYASVSDELYEQCKTLNLYMDILKDESHLGHFYQDEYAHDSFKISFNKTELK